jgi:hypothetical protein
MSAMSFVLGLFDRDFLLLNSHILHLSVHHIHIHSLYPIQTQDVPPFVSISHHPCSQPSAPHSRRLSRLLPPSSGVASTTQFYLGPELSGGTACGVKALTNGKGTSGKQGGGPGYLYVRAPILALPFPLPLRSRSLGSPINSGTRARVQKSVTNLPPRPQSTSSPVAPATG